MSYALYGRHLLSIGDLSSAELADLVAAAIELKARQKRREPHPLLSGRSLAMIFQKPSTRTRTSFEVAMYQLGGQALFLSPNDIQLARGETIGDTARVLSRYCDAIVARVYAHSDLTNLAENASIPVINGLSDYEHPVQALADLQTIREHFGGLRGVRLAYLGDGNNMTHALMLAAPLAGVHMAVGTPPAFTPDPHVIAQARKLAEQAETDMLLTSDPYEAVAHADIVYTDVWVSMGQEDSTERLQALQPYRVTEKLMGAAQAGALFMHCLPMHRGEEVDAAVADGPHSIVFDQAENRLHMHKAILALLCSAEGETLL